jgi:Helix-hairpin-helix motif
MCLQKSVSSMFQFALNIPINYQLITMSKQPIVFLFNLLSINYIFSQTDIQDDFSTEMVENQVIRHPENKFEYDATYEHLFYFKQHPINLNQADYDDLKRLQLLSHAEINQLLNYRQKNGAFLDIYELQSFWKLELINQLLPYIYVDTATDAPTLSLSERLQRGSHQLYIRLARQVEPSAGFLKSETNGGYRGDANNTYTRYGYRFSNDIAYGFTFEKDAGEKSYIDFKSIHFQMKYPISKVKKLYLGDFSARLGQGLIHNNGFTIGKSAATLALENTAPVLQAYRSVNENDFLRGAATTIALGEATEATIFSSYRQFDATLKQLNVKTLYYNGLHRTHSEMARDNSLGVWTTGIRYENRLPQITIGYNAIVHQFQYLLNQEPTAQSPFPFKGQLMFNMSFDYNAMYQNKHFFGETAWHQNGAIATTNSISFTMAKPLTIIFLHRFFDKKYHAFSATTFGENSRVKDENGLYIGFQYLLKKRWTITGYADMWRNNTRIGNEILLNAAFKRKNLEFFFQIKHKSLFQPDEDTVFFTKRQHFRFNMRYVLSKNWIGANRLEWVETQSQNGFMIYQDLFWKPSKLPFHINGRYAYFDTDSFQSVIYAYENDLLSNYSVAKLYFRGSRFYLNLGYAPHPKWLVEARLARTIWQNQHSIGSSLDKTEGNLRTDWKIQVRVRL